MKTCPWLLLFLFFGSITLSCKKFRMEKEVPACIETTTKERAKSVTNPDAVVLEYEFQSKLVYVYDLNPGKTDSQAEVLNTDCHSIGFLGGTEKNRIINGEDFASAVFKRQVWPVKDE